MSNRIKYEAVTFFYRKGVKLTSCFLSIIQHHYSGTEGENVTIFHMWSDTELVALIFSVHLDAVLIVWIVCAAGLSTWTKHPRFRIWSLLKHFSPTQTNWFCQYWESGDCLCAMWPVLCQNSLSTKTCFSLGMFTGVIRVNSVNNPKKCT